AGCFDQRAFKTRIQFACDCGDALIAELSKERGGQVVLQDCVASLVLVENDAERRVERRRQLVLRHPRSSQRITYVVLHRLAGLASDLQQSAMISAVKDRKRWSTLQFLSSAVAFTVVRQYEDPGVELGD